MLRAERERESQRDKLLSMRLDIIIQSLRPELGNTLLDAYKDSTIKEDLKVTAENFHEEWEELMKVVPAEITLPKELERNYLSGLKRFDRKKLKGNKPEGIVIQLKE